MPKTQTPDDSGRFQPVKPAPTGLLAIILATSPGNELDEAVAWAQRMEFERNAARRRIAALERLLWIVAAVVAAVGIGIGYVVGWACR